MSFHTQGTTPNGTTPVKKSSKWTFSQTGVTKLVETWQINTANLARNVPAYQTPHPTVAGLYVSQDVEAEDDGNCGMSLATIIYEGYTGGTGEGGGGGDISNQEPVYEWNGTLETKQIQLNPKFDAVIEWVKSEGYDPEDDQGRFVGFPVGSESEDGRPLAGITSYLAMGGSWVKRWIQRSRPVSMDGVGYVGTPPGGPPAFSDSREWLVGPMTYREAGGVFECSQTWFLSEAGGFSTFYHP